MRALTVAGLMLATMGQAIAETMHPGGFPTPMGPVASLTADLYNIIFIIIAVVGVGVALAMGAIIWRFRRSRGHKPATFSHNTAIEVAWTVIPAIICVYIAYISYEGLIKVRTMPKDAVTVEVVAYQFGWDFYYPDASENGVHVAAAEPTQPDPEISAAGVERMTKELVVPVGTPVVAHVTSQDVIHAFFVPKLGVKIDAMPGRINYVWFEADQPGSFLGQCAELCGSAHGEMFFRVKAVPQEEFDAYIAARRVDAGLTATPQETAAPVEAVAEEITAPAEASPSDVLPETVETPVGVTEPFVPVPDAVSPDAPEPVRP